MKFLLGINAHRADPLPAVNSQVASLMQQRNFKTARFDYYSGASQSSFRNLVSMIRANGGQAEVSLQISYQWDHSIDTSPADLTATYNDAYAQTKVLVSQISDIVEDYELLNEINHRPECLAQVPINTGTSETVYANKSAYTSITNICRAMADAIHDIGSQAGRPLRVILGTTGRDWGMIDFMKSKGVKFDVVGWHNYPHLNHPSMLTDPWYGPGGPLARLGTYGKPIHFNEFNSGEIYDAGYENRAGGLITENGLKAVARHLLDLSIQTLCPIESLHFYELLDEPGKPAPENHFGLMYSLSSPKVALFLATAFAGGYLTTSEQLTITSRGLLTDTQIAGFKSLNTTPTPSPTPAPTPAPSPTPTPAPTSMTVSVAVDGVVAYSTSAPLGSKVTFNIA